MISDIKKKSNIRSYILIVIFFVLDFIVLLVYSILINVSSWARAPQNDKEHLGWTNSAIIGLTDILLIVWGTLSSKGIYLTPFKSSLMLLIAWILISFGANYWIIIQTSVFFILLVLFATSWVWKNISVDSALNSRIRLKNSIYKAISQTSHLKKHLIEKKLITEDIIKEEIPLFKSSKWWVCIIELIPTLILFLGFFAYCFIVTYVPMTNAWNPEI